MPSGTNANWSATWNRSSQAVNRSAEPLSALAVSASRLRDRIRLSPARQAPREPREGQRVGAENLVCCVKRGVSLGHRKNKAGEVYPATRILIGIGAAFVAAGLIWQLAARFLPLGRLPGDIAIERGPVRIYFPIVTCLIISAALSVAIWAWQSWRR